MTMPIYDKFVNVDDILYAPLGVIYAKEDPFTVQSVISGSRAEKFGLQSGDRLSKVELEKFHMPRDVKHANKYIKKNIKTIGWKVFDYVSKDGYFAIEVLRNGNKMKLKLDPVSTYFQRSCVLP